MNLVIVTTSVNDIKNKISIFSFACLMQRILLKKWNVEEYSSVFKPVNYHFFFSPETHKSITSNTMNTRRYIIIDIFILPTVSIGSIISFSILFLIFYHRRQFPIDTSKLLICNTYIAIILACLTLLDLYAHNVYGMIHENVSFDNWWCYGCIYLLYVGLCSLYFSCLLQAVFRLFRVVFYKYKQLQNFRFIFRLVLIQ
jgi:hypothetical protein